MSSIFSKKEVPASKPASVLEQPRKEDVPKLSISFDRIKDAIVFVENNILLGAGKITKTEHLVDHLFSIIKHGSDNPDKPVLTYEEIMAEVKNVYEDHIFGAGKYTKKDHLADRLFGRFTLKQKSQRDAEAAAKAAAAAAAAAAQQSSSEAPKVRKVQPPQPQQNAAPDGDLAFQ